jgi:hypothetical protein
MAKPHSIHLNLEQLPKLHSKDGGQLALYLESVMTDNLSDTVHFVEFPSIHLLSEHLNCSSMQLYDAVRALRMRGYDYRFSSLDENIQIWLNELNERRNK